MAQITIPNKVDLTTSTNTKFVGSDFNAIKDAINDNDGRISTLENGGVGGGGLPAGGTTGKVLKKASNADYDVVWGTDATGGGGSGSSALTIIDDITEFASYAGDADTVILCKDSNRTSNKLFIWNPTGVADNGIRYATSTTGTWDMQDKGDSYFANWYGADPTNTNDCADIIRDAGHRCIEDGILNLDFMPGVYKISKAAIAWGSVNNTTGYAQICFDAIEKEQDFTRLTLRGICFGSNVSSLAGSATSITTTGVIFNSTINPVRSGGLVAYAVIGTKWYPAGTYSGGTRYSDCSYMGLHVENITIRRYAGTVGSPIAPTMTGLDGSHFLQLTTHNVAVDTSIPANAHGTLTQLEGVTGIIFPNGLNYALLRASGATTTCGCWLGVRTGEHGLIDYLTTYACDYGVQAPNATGHRTSIIKLQVEACKWGVFSPYTSGCDLYIETFGAEQTDIGATYDYVADVACSGSTGGDIPKIIIANFLAHKQNSSPGYLTVDGNVNNVICQTQKHCDVINGTWETYTASEVIDGHWHRNIRLSTYAGNRTLTARNTVTGQTGTVIFVQDATGSRTLTLPSGSVTTASYAIDPAANAVSVLTYFYNGVNFIWSTITV